MAITAITKISSMKSTLEETESIAATKETADTKAPLLGAIADESVYKRTENGALALSSTKNPLLDFFGTSGALRTRTPESICHSFMQAFEYDEVHAMKALFYTRDVRGGQGERRTFRVILNHLAKTHPDAVARNIELVSEYGRFDDLYCLVGTPLETLAFQTIAAQWNKDAEAIAAKEYGRVSLLGKWLKSENASSAETKRLAKLTYTSLGLSPKEYRQSLSAFREVIHIVEKAMSEGKWDTIDYSKLPSLAHKKYRAAFARHDKDGYEAYLESLKKGETKINASTLYPYDLVREYANNRGGWYSGRGKATVDETVEAQWKALPNYLTGDDSFLVMVDTSGSMFPDAICSSVGLGIYFAERAKGLFKNHFISFTDTPRLVEIPHSAKATLLDKVNKVLDSDYVGYSTNLEAAFQLVLDSAVKGGLKQEDMPRAIVVISDMEIDQIGRYGREDAEATFTIAMAKRFEAAGYKMPTLVYWNVEARQDTFHATANENVRFVSGQSASTFKTLCEDVDGFSAVALMLKVLDGERYAAVK